MNYDEYIEEVRKHSDDKIVAQLDLYLCDWKSDGSSVIELADAIEKYFGTCWIAERETHEHLYALWQNFKKQAVLGIAGMTMNERLYRFGLMERFDAASEQERGNFYKKLCADI